MNRPITKNLMEFQIRTGVEGDDDTVQGIEFSYSPSNGGLEIALRCISNKLDTDYLYNDEAKELLEWLLKHYGTTTQKVLFGGKNE